MQLDYWVRRKGTDPTSATCLYALRDIMQAPVSDVRCGDLWRFDVDAEDVEQTRAAIVRAARRAGRYVNDNRDIGSWLETPAPATSGDGALFDVDIWVCDHDGRDEVARRYFQQQALPRLRGLRRGRLYRLRIVAADATAARSIAEEVMVSRSRHHGLLLNPHSQTGGILGVQPTAAQTEMS